jgi:hypothetical protein
MGASQSSAAVGGLLPSRVGSIDRHRLGKRRHGGIVRSRAVDDRGQCTWRDERKRGEKANVLSTLPSRSAISPKDRTRPDAISAIHERALAASANDAVESASA